MTAATAGAGSVGGRASLADTTSTFRVAASTVCLPAILFAGADDWLPETHGLDLDRSAPEPTVTTPGAAPDGVRHPVSH